MRAFLLLLLAAPALGHGGGLDDYGCHRDRKRGGYHCHKGEFDGRRWESRSAGRKAMDALREKAETAKDAGCAPMDALGRGRGRRHFGWMWDGVGCSGVSGSKCEGKNCRDLYRTRDQCLRARFSCPAGTEYYRYLEGKCGKLNACCLRSVELMRANGQRAAIDGNCPEGYTQESLRCESSLIWCLKGP